MAILIIEIQSCYKSFFVLQCRLLPRSKPSPSSAMIKSAAVNVDAKSDDHAVAVAVMGCNSINYILTAFEDRAWKH